MVGSCGQARLLGRGARASGGCSILPRRRRSTGSAKNTAARKSRSTRKTWKLDVEAVAGEVIREVVDRLGIDYLGLTERELRDVIEPIIAEIAEARSTKPSVESLVKRIVAGKEMLFKALAARLLEREDLTLEQIEFIVAYAPQLAGRAAPRLYRAAAKLGADHIIDALRTLWELHGAPTPIECPYCGFRAVTPAMECMVCGRVVEERDLKEKIGFRDLLVRFAEEADPALVEEVLRAGFAIYDGEIKPPSMRARAPMGVELFLSRGEREAVREVLARRSLRA